MSIADTLLFRTFPRTGAPNSSWTSNDGSTLPIPVGSGPDRRAVALQWYYNATTPVPDTFNVGPDALAAQGAAFSGPSGNKFRIFEGPLSVEGDQHCSGTYTGTTNLEGGGTGFVILITDAAAPHAFGNLTAIAAHSVGSGSFDRTRIPASTVDDVAYWLGVITEGAPVVTPVLSTTNIAVTGAGGSAAKAGRKAGAAGSTELGFNLNGGSEVIYFGFTYTESQPAGLTIAASLDPVTSSLQFLQNNLLTISSTLDDVVAALAFSIVPGTIVLSPLANGADSNWANRGDVNIRIYDEATGALLINLDNRTTDAMGIPAPVVSAALVSGQWYEVRFRIPTSPPALGVWRFQAV